MISIHQKSESLRVNQIVVKVDGWQRLCPLSVDKVGTYYRTAVSDAGKQSIFNRVSTVVHYIL